MQHQQHATPATARPAGLPTVLPYRVDALGSTSALVYIWTLPQFQRALAARVTPEVDLGVQALVRHLGMLRAQTPSQLGATLGMTRSNVSKIVGRAEDLGLVTRQAAPADGRSVLVELTEAGDVLAERTMEVGDEMMRELTRGWSADELHQWTLLSRRLAEAAASYAQDLIAAG